MRLVLIGDAESPHLLKWARALCADDSVRLWVASSRGFLPGFDACLAADRRLSLGSQPNAAGGKVALLASLPRLGRWLRTIDPDWINPHYLTSHGTLAWLAQRLWRLRARIVGSAWGSDILVTPQRSAIHRALTAQVLRSCKLCTSDSLHMAERMRALGAGEVMTFPFGLAALPAAPGVKTPWLMFTNRALEPLYRPDRVLSLFSRVVAVQPDARLVLANEGSLSEALRAQAEPLRSKIDFVGRLDARTQAGWYDRAQWYLSLPESDSVSVSVIEAMAHGCIPLLSDLPANHELVRDGVNGLIVNDEENSRRLGALLPRAERIASDNRAWVAEHALFAPAVGRLLDRLRHLS